MSDTENDPVFSRSGRRSFNNWFIKHKERYLEKIQKYRDNLEAMNQEDYNQETMEILRNRQTDSMIGNDNFSDLQNDEMSLKSLRDQRDREINNERERYERENFHDYNYERDNFQQPNFGNNEYRYQWSNNDNYKGFNSNQEREYTKNGDYFQNNSRNSRQQKRNNYQGNRDSYFDKKYMEQLQKQIEDLHLEIKYLKNKPKRGERLCIGLRKTEIQAQLDCL